jgi:opacity protein-like surface antigen
MAFLRATALLGAALVLGNVQGAVAADLGNYDGGSIKDGGYAPYQAPQRSYYVRVDGAWAFYDVDDISIVDQNTGHPAAPAPTPFSNFGSSIDDGWSIGGGIGREFGNGFRGDLTLEYRGSTDLGGSGSADPCCELVETDTKFDGVVGLANLYYDFNRGGRLVPYIGAGIGFAHLKTDGGALSCAIPTATYSCSTGFGDASYGSSSTTNFAVAAMAGLTMKLAGGDTHYVGGVKDAPMAVSSGRALYLDVGYRFLYLGDFDSENAVQSNGNQIDLEWNDLTANEVRVGLRYDLN